jgi:hypothetical protein
MGCRARNDLKTTGSAMVLCWLLGNALAGGCSWFGTQPSPAGDSTGNGCSDMLMGMGGGGGYGGGNGFGGSDVGVGSDVSVGVGTGTGVGGSGDPGETPQSGSCGAPAPYPYKYCDSGLAACLNKCLTTWNCDQDVNYDTCVKTRAINCENPCYASHCELR